MTEPTIPSLLEALAESVEAAKAHRRGSTTFKLASSWDGGSLLTPWGTETYETQAEAQAEADRTNKENPYEESSTVVVRSDVRWPDGSEANWAGDADEAENNR